VTSGKQEQIACPSHIIGLRVRSDQSYKSKRNQKVLWHWDEVHQGAFNHIKANIAKEVVLAYPNYSKVVEIYTDASSKQLGAVIIQDNMPIVFFSWIFSVVQHKYSVTKI
jgi:hypothetical protein